MKNHKKELVSEFLRAFLPALSHAHQYTSSHQLAVSSKNTAYRHLSEVLAGTSTLVVKIVENRIVADEEPLEDAIYVGRFIEYFMSRGIQYIRIQKGITLDELGAFIEAMNSYNPLTMPDMEWFFPNIHIGKVGLGTAEETPEEDKEDLTGEIEDEEADEDNEALRRFEKVFNEDLDLMIDIYDSVRSKHDLPVSEISSVVADIVTAVRQESGLLMSFSPLRALDEYTFTHSTNVCILTIAQAMSLGIKDEILHDIGVAAMLHDIGKIFVPVEILNKKGKPTEAEWALIKEHPRKGAEYLVDKPDIPRLAIIAAFEHHMAYDFSGYPVVASDWRQNLCSQMVTISDFFDSLRTKRAYRGSVETKEIADIMAGMSGKALNPVLTKNFLLLIDKLLQDVKS